MNGYAEIAKALLPLQIKEHESFGGDRWTEENTIAWIRTVSQRSFPNEQPATYGSQPVSESEWMLLFFRAMYKPNKRKVG